MDPHARWLRRHIVRRVTKRAVALAVVIGGSAAGVAVAVGADPVAAVPWALLGAQAVVAGQVCNTALRGVISRRYLEGYAGRSIPFRHEALAASLDTAVEVSLSELGLRPAGLLVVDVPTVDVPSGDGVGEAAQETAPPAYELFSTEDRSVFVLRGRAGGAAVVLSALADGRTLVTSDLLVVPAHLLVTNYCPGRSLPALVTRHRAVVSALARQGLGVRAATPALGVEFLRREQSALAAVGGWLVPFLSFTGSSHFPRLTVGVAPADLRRLATRTRGPLAVHPTPEAPEATDSVGLLGVGSAAGAVLAGNLDESQVNR